MPPPTAMSSPATASPPTMVPPPVTAAPPAAVSPPATVPPTTSPGLNDTGIELLVGELNQIFDRYFYQKFINLFARSKMLCIND